jgi:hypothetical protein
LRRRGSLWWGGWGWWGWWWWWWWSLQGVELCGVLADAHGCTHAPTALCMRDCTALRKDERIRVGKQHCCVLESTETTPNANCCE